MAAWPQSPEQAAVAVCLACGPHAAASHRTAALVWGLEVPPPPLPEVTVPHTHHPTIPTLHAYRVRSLRRGDVVTKGSIRLTSPARTLVDLAAVLDDEALELALDDAIRRRLVSADRLADVLRRPELARYRGTGTLRELVRLRAGTQATESALETLLLRTLRRFGLPQPVPQYPVRTRHGLRRIDFAYPDQRVALEAYGYEAHSRRDRFDDDALRRQDLRELGWTIVEVTWTALLRHPDQVAWAVARALGLRPWRWRSA